MDDLVSLIPSGVLTVLAAPALQVAAVGLSRLPELWGVKHSTVWSRFWKRIAMFPVVKPPAPAPTPVEPPKP